MGSPAAVYIELVFSTKDRWLLLLDKPTRAALHSDSGAFPSNSIARPSSVAVTGWSKVINL